MVPPLKFIFGRDRNSPAARAAGPDGGEHSLVCTVCQSNVGVLAAPLPVQVPCPTPLAHASCSHSCSIHDIHGK